MDCKTVKYCKEAFFLNELDISLRYEVVCHLLRCKECFDEYESCAKGKGLHFDIVREASRVQLECDDNYVPEGEAIYVTKRKSEKVIEFKLPISYKNKPKQDAVDRWTTAHKINDFSDLMNIKAVRDIYNEQKAISKSEEEYRLFVHFLTKKICQHIDYLEKCLRIEKGHKNA